MAGRRSQLKLATAKSLFAKSVKSCFIAILR